MGFLDDVKKFATESASKIADTSKTLAKSTQIKLAISSLKSKKEKVFKEIGERAFVLWKNGKIDDDAIVALCREIESIDAEIEEKEKELKKE